MGWEQDLVEPHGQLLEPFLLSFDAIGRHYHLCAWQANEGGVGVGLLERTESGKRMHLRVLATAAGEGDALVLGGPEATSDAAVGLHELNLHNSGRTLTVSVKGTRLAYHEMPELVAERLAKNRGKILDALRKGAAGKSPTPQVRAQPDRAPVVKATAVIDASNVARYELSGHGSLARLNALVHALRKAGCRIIVVSDQSLLTNLPEHERAEYKKRYTKAPHRIAPAADPVVRQIAREERARGKRVLVIANDNYRDTTETTTGHRIRFTFDGDTPILEGIASALMADSDTT